MNLAFSMKSFSKDNNAISDTVTDTYQVQSNIQNMVAYNVQPYNHSHNVLKNLQDNAEVEKPSRFHYKQNMYSPKNNFYSTTQNKFYKANHKYNTNNSISNSDNCDK